MWSPQYYYLNIYHDAELSVHYNTKAFGFDPKALILFNGLSITPSRQLLRSADH
ncbi:hypothetical protein GGD38_007652 [Chitinophagaceae bacterium OAS944]|nr:hypothetical protein [Chitinophagaceae bacterium OAS944]